MDIDSDLYVVVRNYVRTIAGNDQSPVTEEQLYAVVRKYIIDTYSLSGGNVTEAELTLKIRTLISTLVSEELAAGNISQWVNTTDLFNKIDALIQASIATSFTIPAITVNNYVTNGTVWDDSKIRSIIEDMLDGKLDSIVDGLDQYGNYVEYAFKNASSQPMTPVGGSYDGITFTYPSGWLDDPVSTTNGTDRVWVSYSKWKKINNTYVSIAGWSTPIPVSGTDGSDGTGGQDGIGADGNWHEYIYRISDSVTPSTPVGGYLDNSNNIHPPTGWDDNPVPTTSTKPYLYMSKGVFTKQGSSWVQTGSWSAPVKTTGDSGTDGVGGTPGDPGVDGFDATSVTLLASTQGIGYSVDGTNPSVSSIYFTTQVANYTQGDVLKYTFYLDDVVVRNLSTVDSYTYIVPTNISNFSAPKKFSVKVTSTLFPSDVSEDYVSVYAAKSGSDALTVILSNENHTIPVSNVYDVLTYDYSGSGTKITVYRGTELIRVGSGNNQFTVSASGSNITVGGKTDNTDGTVTYWDSSNITASTATITFTITYKNAAGSTITVTRQQSINRTFDGANGAKVVTGFVYWSNTSTAPNANPSATSYSFTTDSFTGLSSGWQRTPPTLSQGTTTSAIYYATFSAIETAANSNRATNITFGSYTKGTEFKGLVVFTAADADSKIATAASTITNNIKNGLALQNYTTINGGNITTGTINAQQVTITNLRVTGDMLFSGFSKTYAVSISPRNAGTSGDPYFSPLPTAAGQPTNSGADNLALRSDTTWFASTNYLYDGVMPYDNSRVVSYRGQYSVPTKYQIRIKNNFGAAASVSGDLTTIHNTSPTPGSGIGGTGVPTDGYTAIILSAGPGNSGDTLSTSSYSYMPAGCRIIGAAAGGIPFSTAVQQRSLVNAASKVAVGEYLYVTVLVAGTWSYSSVVNNKTWFSGLVGNIYLTI